MANWKELFGPVACTIRLVPSNVRRIRTSIIQSTTDWRTASRVWNASALKKSPPGSRKPSLSRSRARLVRRAFAKPCSPWPASAWATGAKAVGSRPCP